MSSLFLTKLTGALLQSAAYELPVAYHVMHVKIFSFVTITLRTMIAKETNHILWYTKIFSFGRSHSNQSHIALENAILTNSESAHEIYGR